MSNLSDIVDVNISIDSPVVGGAGYDCLLLVGPAPATAPATAPDAVGVYASLAEVTGAGWVASGASADPIGVAAAVAFSQIPHPSKIYVAMQQEAAGETEAIADTLNRALAVSGWYVVCPAGIAETEFAAMATWVEAQQKMLAFTTLATSSFPVSASNYRTMAFFGRTSFTNGVAVPVNNNYLHVAAVAKCLAYTPGSETWVYKSLSGITPSELTSTQEATLKAANVNWYTKVAGKSITMGGVVTAGEWIDTIRFRDWLENDMQTRVVGLLTANPKIPYTNSGIALVENMMIASLKAGQDNGGIAEDQYDADGNLTPGFEVEVPNASDLTADQRASRTLTDCKFSALLASAIQVVQIHGSLTYSF